MMPQKNPPAESEINVHDSLDEQTAVRHFGGKTIEEAEELFRDNSIFYQEDLMWMGPAAFAYYVQAAINYLKSPEGAGDHAMVHALTTVLQYRLDCDTIPGEVLPDLLDLLQYIIDNHQWASMEPDYPRTRECCLRLRERIQGAF